MYEQRDTSVPRKDHDNYRDRGDWGTTKIRNIHILCIASTLNRSRTIYLNSRFDSLNQIVCRPIH